MPLSFVKIMTNGTVISEVKYPLFLILKRMSFSNLFLGDLFLFHNKLSTPVVGLWVCFSYTALSVIYLSSALIGIEIMLVFWIKNKFKLSVKYFCSVLTSFTEFSYDFRLQLTKLSAVNLASNNKCGEFENEFSLQWQNWLRSEFHDEIL